MRLSARRGRACFAACALTLILSAPASAQLPELVFNDGFDEPATFRVSDLDLRDPHTYANSAFGCLDLTNLAAFGITGVNPQLQTSIQTDGNADGLLDLSGDPASGLVDGLVAGFLSEATANATIIPASIPQVGGLPVSRLLPGGTSNCASHSDKDVHNGHNGVTGWWLYLNFTAADVDYEG